MVKKTAIPDAWDDDWEAQADKAEEIAAQIPEVEQPAKITKAERLAKHAESNKKLWDSAESPEPFHFLAARDTIPLKQEFKPTLKVLSRKPAPKVIAKQDPITGLQKLTVEDEDEDDEDEGKKPSPEELRLKAQKEREEKQKRYDEARAKIFGTGEGSASGSGRSSPAGGKKGRGKGERGSRPGSSGSVSLGQQNLGQEKRELFDPGFTPKSVGIQQRGTSSSGRSTPRGRDENQVIRQPRAPDSSGAGFGKFAPGGSKGV